MFGSKRSSTSFSPMEECGDDSPDSSASTSSGQKCSGRPKMEVAKAAEFRSQQIQSGPNPHGCQSGGESEPSGLTRILPFLYLGSQHDALDEECLKQHQIEYVINLSVGGSKPSIIDEDNFLRIPVNDTQAEKLLPHFDRAFEFLDRVEKSNSCALVHCLAGISRSPTLAIAFVMKHLGLRSEEAYKFVKAKRPVISPNFNFLGQLLEFEKRIGVRKRENSDCPEEMQSATRPQSDNFSAVRRSPAPIEVFQAKNMRRSFSAPLKVQRSSDRSALRIDLAAVSPEQRAGRNNKREMVDSSLDSLSHSIQSTSISNVERPKSNTVPIAHPHLLSQSVIESILPTSIRPPVEDKNCCRPQDHSASLPLHPCCSNCLQVDVDMAERSRKTSQTSAVNWSLAETFERHISPGRLNNHRQIDTLRTAEVAEEPKMSAAATTQSRSPSPIPLRCISAVPHPTSVENPLFRTAVFRSSLKRLRAAQISPGRDVRAATEVPIDTPRGVKSLKRASWPRGTPPGPLQTCLGALSNAPGGHLKSPDDGFSDGQFAGGYSDPDVKDWGSTGSLEIVVS